jgi:hypothetical protein
MEDFDFEDVYSITVEMKGGKKDGSGGPITIYKKNGVKKFERLMAEMFALPVVKSRVIEYTEDDDEEYESERRSVPRSQFEAKAPAPSTGYTPMGIEYEKTKGIVNVQGIMSQNRGVFK